jgi:hypothetical protein
MIKTNYGQSGYSTKNNTYTRTVPMPESSPTQNMATFRDFENIALELHNTYYVAFNIQKMLERLLIKGNSVVKNAYYDLYRYKELTATMHESDESCFF